VFKSFIIDIEKGMKDGDKIVIDGEGNEMEGYERCDMVFVLKEKKHEKFERRGYHLFYYQTLLFGDSLLGYNVELEDLKNEKISYYENGVIEQNMMRRIKNKGMPIRNSNGDFGDLYVVYKIKYGGISNMTEEDREVIRRIFPCLQNRDGDEFNQNYSIIENSEIIHDE